MPADPTLSSFDLPAPPTASCTPEAIDAVLPQTQCTRCGFADCRGYAEAISVADAPIDRCPPGGAEGIARLSRSTGRPVLPLDPAHGVEGPRRAALIDEAACIGCTLCLQACPVDCIVGAPQRMHTVVAPQCTGCELCLPACPVDCISLVDASGGRTGWAAWSAADAAQARARYRRHRQRLGHERADSAARRTPQPPRRGSTAIAAGLADSAADAGASTPDADRPVRPAAPASGRPEAPGGEDGKRAVVEAALARARARAFPR